MRLSELLAALPAELAPTRRDDAGADPVIRGMGYDSRNVAPGDLFAALRGEIFDGHDYLEQAVRLGAAAVLVESVPESTDLGRCAVVQVPDSRRAMAPLAAAFFGAPARELQLIGVTGTNGKTSTTYLLEAILAAAGRRPGLVGTVEVRFPGVRRRAMNTTPESLDLQRTLREMRTAGVDAVAMEVSSHGLELGRVEGCHFRVAAFTNVTQDHLDFHHTMEAYLDSKTLLFRRHLAPDGIAVLNLDDPAADAFARAARSAGGRTLGVSRRPDADAEIVLETAEARIEGTRARLRLPSGPLEVELPLLGDFNLENLLVAAGAAVAAEIDPDALAAGVAACPQVPGRVERVASPNGSGPTVIVDYAHTPDAVEKLLAAMRPLSRGRIVAVFGCGGDRDRGKRPLMAEAVARHADLAIATSDNPRTEDPEAILDDVVPGLAKLQRTEPEALPGAARAWARVCDRRAAIELAVRAAADDDTVVIAGKGHEDYQIIGSERLPFDDRQEAHRALAARSGR